MSEYPHVGFHFLVNFQLPRKNSNDARFMEVTGLDVEMEMESYTEGGQNRFVWQLPKRARYADITFKRTMFIDSAIVEWCKNAFQNFIFEPTSVTISLLNEKHDTLQAWHVVNAIPKKWSIGGLNAQDNSLMIESLTLSYQYFNVLTG